MGQMRSIDISLPTTSCIYVTFLKLLNEIHIEHQLMRNFTKLFHLICNITDLEDDNKMTKNSEILIEQHERFESKALYEIANRFRIRSHKFNLQRNEKHSTDDDIGYVSRSSSEEIDEKRRNINDHLRDILYCSTNLDDERFASMSKVTISDEDDCMDKDTITDDELRNQKDDNSYNTTYVLNGERRVQIGYIDFNRLDIIITKPELLTHRKIPSGIDLAFKKMKLKATLPTLELHSFGSESSLASFDEKAIMHSIPTPMKRSRIPRATIPINSNGTIRKSHPVVTYDT
ncbi:hypothetical protein LOAG_18985 [Loa loa]|uniref:Uncharacterized protein n=1 Tax=Loa loa TaxID=7209 RepID=A0A1S0UE00_LOALO|nr:hypothetical protein LOAG_18985 [Loa loa]EJD73598.1 hypothetical protein LOAG_18985 [Loa loa]